MQLKYLIVLMLLCAAPGFFSGADAWYASQAALLIRELIAAVIIYKLLNNTLGIVWLVSCTWDALLISLWLYAPDAHSTVNYLLWPILLYVAVWHTYRTAPTQLDPKATYVAFGRVKSPQGLLVASLTLCGGSTAVVTNGLLYKYKEGVLQRKAFYNTRGYVMIKVSDKSAQRLDSLLGTRWTWGNNCLTLIVKVALWTR